MKTTRDLVLLSLLIALSIVLRGVEALIPNPLPWLRIGLANIMTLLAIMLFGLKAGLLLTVLRTLMSSLLFGSFLSPTFFLSFFAGIASTLAMGAALRWGGALFSPVGVSVLGGVVHNFAQLIVAYALIIRQIEIFYLFPPLALLGIATGFLNGWIVVVLHDHLHTQTAHLLPHTAHVSEEYE